MEEKVTAKNVVDAIYNKYSDPQRYAVLEQVNEGTGYTGFSWIDVMVLSLWPSDGLLRSAFEVKISRADFLNELKKGSKNQYFKNNCDEFWYATAKDVVKTIDEIPEGCGWMVLQKNGLIVKKQAQRKENENIDRSFLASIVRSACNSKGIKRSNLRKEIKKEGWFIRAEKAAEAIESYMKSHKDRWYLENQSVGEIVAALEDSNREEKDEKDIENIQEGLENIRGAMGKYLFELLPMSISLLNDLNKEGHYVTNHYGHSSLKNWDILSCLVKNSKGRYSTKVTKKELEVFREMLREKL